MSSDHDASADSDQAAHDDGLKDEDAGGLFGSGSEDEGLGYRRSSKCYSNQD